MREDKDGGLSEYKDGWRECRENKDGERVGEGLWVAGAWRAMARRARASVVCTAPCSRTCVCVCARA